MLVNPPGDSAPTPGISPELLYEKLGFEAHSKGQQNYLYSTARFNTACCGRRYGKSITAGHRMTLKSFKPDSYNWIVGTSYRIGEKEFRVVWDDYQKLDLLRHCRKSFSPHQGDMHITTPWGAHIMVVSADNQDALLGEGLSHAIMSESARHSRATWEQFIEPALSDLKGSCDFPSTPKGFNWYHGLFMLGQESKINPKFDNYQSYHFPTWENTVRFPGGRKDPEIQRVERTVSDHWFLQEYGALFTSMSGSIFDEWDEKRHVIEHYEFDAKSPNFIAFDYGFANPFVALDIQVIPGPSGPTTIVWREYYKSQMSTTEHGAYLKNRENPEGYRVDGMWGDPRGADEAATLALFLGHVASHDVRWKLSIEQIKRMLNPAPDTASIGASPIGTSGTIKTPAPKLLIHKSCANLIRQMSTLHVKEQSKQSKFEINEQAGDGNIQHKKDDHAVDALRYFIGPYFVSGADSSLVDVYGENYRGSESEDFFTLQSNVTLDDTFSIMSSF